MTERLWKPGHRVRTTGSGMISDDRIAWLDSDLVNMRLYLKEHPPEELAAVPPPEDGPNIILHIGRRSGSPISLNLTNASSEDLREMMEFLRLALALAEPIVNHRDEVAQNARDTGEQGHLFHRLHRRPPSLTTRERVVLSHLESLQDRFGIAPSSYWGPAVLGTGSAGEAVAEPLPSGTGAQDNPPQDGEPS
jgi:hypothetical protein